MSNEKTTSTLEADEAAAARSGDSQSQDVILNESYTHAQESRVVKKLDWNLMTLFFVLCK